MRRFERRHRDISDAGEAPPSRTPEERKAHLASFDTREKALQYLNTETDRLLTAIRGYDDARWGENSDLFGRPMTMYSLAEMPGVHMMYHDWQLNYIQTLDGDKEIHWW